MRVRLISRFYIRDVVVVKSSYITFVIHKEQFAFQVHALRITKKLSFCLLSNFGQTRGLLSCEVCFLVSCVKI